jgi:hypothetical protein
MVRVGHDGADIVEHGGKDLLKVFGPFLEISGVGDVKELRARQPPDQAGVRLFDGGERRSGESASPRRRMPPSISST